MKKTRLKRKRLQIKDDLQTSQKKKMEIEELMEEHPAK